MTLSPIARPLLWPLGWLYGGVMLLRRGLYRSRVLRSRKLPGAVISVGNLTVGGTSKTPMVLWIAERLAAEGHRPAILTRGYAGLGQSDAGARTPDEVALLRRRLDGRAQFGVGKDRYAAGVGLARDGADWFILDDGFQHLAVLRDADIVLLDATDPFGGGGIIPAGRLREPRSALARADVVVITRTSRAPALEVVVRRLTQAPIFYAQARLDAVLRVPAIAAAVPESDWRKAKYFAFCGIGNPLAFFDDLREWGFSVVGRRTFADHHRYSAAEMQRLDAAAAAAGADALVCTEKDAFNLDSVTTALPIYACRIQLALNDEEDFWGAVKAAIGRNRPRTQA